MQRKKLTFGNTVNIILSVSLFYKISFRIYLRTEHSSLSLTRETERKQINELREKVDRTTLYKLYLIVDFIYPRPIIISHFGFVA